MTVALTEVAETRLEKLIVNANFSGFSPSSSAASFTIVTTIMLNGALVQRQTGYLCEHLCMRQRKDDSDTSPRAPCNFDRLQTVAVCPRLHLPPLSLNVAYLPRKSDAWHGDTKRDAWHTCFGSQEKRDAWTGPAQFAHSHFDTLYDGLRVAVEDLPTPFTILESGNFCGASTCLLAYAKRALCPQCKFISVDPGFERRRSNDIPHDCVEQNLARVGLLTEVTVLDNTVGQNAPINGPVGFVFNDDGKLHSIVSQQLDIWGERLMDGAVIAFHDYFRDSNFDNLRAQELVATHRTLIGDLLDTGDYEPLVLPSVETVVPTTMKHESPCSTFPTICAVAIIQKKGNAKFRTHSRKRSETAPTYTVHMAAYNRI